MVMYRNDTKLSTVKWSQCIQFNMIYYKGAQRGKPIGYKWITRGKEDHMNLQS